LEDQEDVPDLLKGAPKYLQELAASCEGRVLAIENGTKSKKKDTRPDECQQQVEAIVRTALKLREDNRCVL
jgi:hypothetical protein